MKELSIEEKAKAYDEAIERAKKHCADYVVETIFPELKESIDERVKKVIKQVLSESTTEKDECYLDNGVTQQEVFAWLEKQGEQKPDIDFSDLRTWKYIVDAVWTEKEGIGQYLDSPFTEEVAKKLQKRFGNIEQKPVWSEDDEVMIKVFDSIIRYIVEVVDKDALERFGTKREELFSWLKSIKDRVQLQPRQEWSEEDESKIRHLIAFLDTNPNSVIYSRPKEEWIDWLKSLRPQNRWKPSDEQMVALQEAMNIVGILTITGSKINSLYQDLKKLKG